VENMDIAKKYTVSAEGLVLMKNIPEGTQIRGAFGETMLQLDLPAKEQFENNTPTTFYFRDALPVHSDNGVGYPVFGKDKMVHYFCNKCNQLIRTDTEIETMTRLDRDTKKAAIFSADLINGRFQFEIVANLRYAEHIKDLETVLAFIKEYGLRIGKQHNKGYKLKVTNITSKIISDIDIEQRAEEIQKYGTFLIHFLGNAILKADPTQSLITALHFYKPDAGMIEGKLVASVPASTDIFMMHFKQLTKKLYTTKERGAPKGYITVGVAQAPNNVFYTALALAEYGYGIGDWVSFGKGNFIVEKNNIWFKQ